jgi:ABC-type protease/lipase transport system fused ATPase/permease subunit
MVTQETAMFNRSARDNIAYGRPEATEDEIIAAAKAAEADEFIAGMIDHQGRRAMTPTWANAGSSCRAGSASASRWPAPS